MGRHTLTKFEMEMEAKDLKRQLFDIKKYRSRPMNVTFASGISKSTVYKQKKRASQQAMNIYVSH